MAPRHDTIAGARYLALRALARAQGRPTAELLQLYALEGFLTRLACSPHRRRFVLKGGVLLAALDARRPTREVDLLALQTPDEIEAVRELVGEVALLQLDDGLELELGPAEAIREGDAYAGVRVSLRGRLASARLVFHVDVNVGDPVWPAPTLVAVSRLLSPEPLSLSGYPIAMVLAEKIVTALQRGTANTRWRDFADLYVLAHRHVIVGAELQRAVEEVAAYRVVPLLPLEGVLMGFDALGQSRWAAWRRRHGLGERLPEPFVEVLDLVLHMASPVLARGAGGIVWRPETRRWEAAPDMEGARERG